LAANGAAREHRAELEDQQGGQARISYPVLPGPD
jgi:hypothetical protein